MTGPLLIADRLSGYQIPLRGTGSHGIPVLNSAGFDPGVPALFLGEGVLPYLKWEAVESMLRMIAVTASGGIVAFNYFTTQSFVSRSLCCCNARAGTRAVGESLKFALDSTPPSYQRLVEFLQACGLELSQQRTLGEEGRGSAPGVALRLRLSGETWGVLLSCLAWILSLVQCYAVI